MPPQSRQQKGSFLLTVVLRHDQSKTVSEINERLKQNGYFQKFPQGIEVVSWEIVMGIGQVVTLRCRPPGRARSIASSRRPRGAAIALSFMQPTTIRRSPSSSGVAQSSRCPSQPLPWFGRTPHASRVNRSLAILSWQPARPTRRSG
jgi:hypothetical protein